MQPLCFSLSVLYSINYTDYSIPYYKIGFAVGDSGQLQGDVSVPSTFKAGWAKL